jgi:hypothetical protein
MCCRKSTDKVKYRVQRARCEEGQLRDWSKHIGQEQEERMGSKMVAT